MKHEWQRSLHKAGKINTEKKDQIEQKEKEKQNVMNWGSL
jgi:hypothetical protein